MTSNDMQIYMDSNDMQAYEIPSEEIPTVISSVLNGVAESKKRVKKPKKKQRKLKNLQRKHLRNRLASLRKKRPLNHYRQQRLIYPPHSPR